MEKKKKNNKNKCYAKMVSMAAQEVLVVAVLSKLDGMFS